MDEPLVITHSDIKNFLTCRRAFFWDFVCDFRKPEKLVGPMPLGSRVHKALEHHYVTSEEPLPFYETLVRADEATLEEEDPAPWVLDQLYSDAIVGRNCVSSWWEWLMAEGADAGYRTQAVEQIIEAPLLGGRVLLRGKVDVLFERIADDALVIDDWKTVGGWEGGTREQLERSWQHHCYLIALRLTHPDLYVAEANYTVMRKVKRISRTSTPLVRRFRVPGTTRTADTKLGQLEQICTEIVEFYESTKPGGGFNYAYPSPSHVCSWCDYKQPCEISDESIPAARDMLKSELFIRGKKHGRYSTS